MRIDFSKHLKFYEPTLGKVLLTLIIRILLVPLALIIPLLFYLIGNFISKNYFSLGAGLGIAWLKAVLVTFISYHISCKIIHRWKKGNQLQTIESQNGFKPYFKKILKFASLPLLIDYSYFISIFGNVFSHATIFGSVFMKIIGQSFSKIYHLEPLLGGTRGGLILISLFLVAVIIHYLLLGVILERLHSLINKKSSKYANITLAVIYFVLFLPIILE